MKYLCLLVLLLAFGCESYKPYGTPPPNPYQQQYQPQQGWYQNQQPQPQQNNYWPGPYNNQPGPHY